MTQAMQLLSTTTRHLVVQLHTRPVAFEQVHKPESQFAKRKQPDAKQYLAATAVCGPGMRTARAYQWMQQDTCRGTRAGHT